MNVSLQTIVSVAAGAAIAISGWFGANESALASKVDTLATQQAATSQYTTDIDSRLTRIESKLDALAGQNAKLSVAP